MDTLVLNTDSAKALIKTAACLAEVAGTDSTIALKHPRFMHARCMMHMMFAAFVYMVSELDIINPMYCATVRANKGDVKRGFRDLIKASIEAKIRFIYADPGVHHARNAKCVELLDHIDDQAHAGTQLHQFAAISLNCKHSKSPSTSSPSICQPTSVKHKHHRSFRDGNDERGQQRRRKGKEARQKLLKICPGDWQDTEYIYHFCGMTCSCRNRADAAKLVFNTLDEALLNSIPGVPALNRWNKVYPPIVFWFFTFAFHGVAKDAFIQYCKEQSTAAQKAAMRVLGRRDNLTPATQEEQRAKNIGRINKAAAWLEGQDTFYRLALCSTLLSATIPLLGEFFSQARMSVRQSVKPFLFRETSPVIKAINIADTV